MTPEEVVDIFAPVAQVRCRAMFGGLGIYEAGLMIGLVAFSEIYLKVDRETEATFSEAGSAPFVYEGKNRPVRMSYWRLPPAAFEDEEALARWVDLARCAARRAADARPPRRPASRRERPPARPA